MTIFGQSAQGFPASLGPVYTYIRDEAALQQAQERSTKEERVSPAQPELAAGDNAPQHHLCWYPAVWPCPLGYQLRRQLGTEERELEDGVAEVEVCVDGSAQLR